MREFMKGAMLVTSLVVASSQVAAAQQTIDQQQTSSNSNLSGINDWNGQTFIPTANNVSGAGFLLFTGFFVDAVNVGATVALWNGNPTESGSSQLASQSITFSLGNSVTAWVDVFWSAVAVNPGSTYWLFIGRSTSEVQVRAANNGTAAYANGNAWFTFDRRPLGTIATADLHRLDDTDLAFRTFSEHTVVTTPEPASLLLISSGLGALGLARRRRKSQTA